MRDRYDFAVSLVKDAGREAMEARGRQLTVSAKNGDPRNLVTNVDLEIDRFIRVKINAEFPGEKIYSEETAGEIELNGNFWSVDPIDGTANFARGIPHYAVVVSWIEKGEPVLGAIYNPATGELFSFEKGRGPFLNEVSIRASEIKALKDAHALLHIGRKEENWEWGINLQKKFLAQAKKNTNLGSSALDLAFLAAGRVDSVIYGSVTTVDIAVAVAMVRTAGGEVYGLDGAPIRLSLTPQRIIAASTRELFGEISQM